MARAHASEHHSTPRLRTLRAKTPYLGCLLAAFTSCVQVESTSALHCDGAIEFREPTGDIVAVGHPLSSNAWRMCIWFVNPTMSPKSLTFHTNFASFAVGDHLTLLDNQMNVLAVYSRDHPIPQQIHLDVGAVAWKLNARSADTRVGMSYISHKDHPFVQIFALELSPLSFAIVLGVAMALVLLGGFVAPLVLLARWRHKRQLERITQASLDKEARLKGQLEALPQRTYQEQAGKQDECCMCIEKFCAEDVLRILPCDHYYHKDCIDKWFHSKRFQERRCPLCNANPAVHLPTTLADCTEVSATAEDGDLRAEIISISVREASPELGNSSVEV